jgi:hypothetical protein
MDWLNDNDGSDCDGSINDDDNDYEWDDDI